jgi:hypothetical protein
VFDRWQAGIAICNCLYGVQLLFSEDMAAAFCPRRSTIDQEGMARLRPPLARLDRHSDGEHRIRRGRDERCAKDNRFVQVLVLAMQEVPLGRRHFWPIYAACERHGLPLGIHAGSAYRNPVTSLGWPTWYIEDYASQSQVSSRRS